MLFSMYVLRDSVARLNSIIKGIKPTTSELDYDIIRGKSLGIAYDMSLASNEAYFTLKNVKSHRANNAVKTLIDEISNSNTLEELKDACSSCASFFKDYKFDEYSTNSFEGLASVMKSNFYYNAEHVPKFYEEFEMFFMESFKNPRKRTYTCFHPNCYEGIKVSGLKVKDNETLWYGNTIKEEHVKKARSNMHRVITGKMFGSRIQNEAFDIVFGAPTLEFSIQSSVSLIDPRNMDKDNIMDNFRYLRTGGLYILCIPFFRLYQSMCRFISRNLRDVQVFKSTGSDFNDTGIVYIVGYKESSTEPRQNVYNTLRQCHDPENIETIMGRNIDIVLPDFHIPITIFKGSKLDTDEMENILRETNLVNKSIDAQRVEKLDETIKNPLLPFNIGQLGLVLTSGCLDGVVDEGDGNKHLIKGRVSKEIMQVEEQTPDGLSITDTTVNKVEINVLMPNGEFKVLA